MINKMLPRVIYGIFGLVVLSATIFFIHKWLSYKNDLIEFQKKEAYGKIVRLKDLTRGIYAIELSSKIHLPNLRIGWEIEKYNIQVGDSVSKEANSKMMIFYKFENGVYKKYYEYEIGM